MATDEGTTALMHFVDRRMLQRMFMGTSGTWHSGTNISLPSLQHREHGEHIPSTGSK